MRPIQKLVSCFLSALILSSAAVTAANAQTTGGKLVFKDINNAETLITFTDGSKKAFGGALDTVKSEEAAALEGVSSYELLYGGKTLLTVTLRDIQNSNGTAANPYKMNGYYAVDIENIRGNKSAFVTGLSPSNVQQVEDALIKSASSNEAMDITALDFIDTEKQGLEESDLYLCWAGASANVLTYTGWAEQAGFRDSDELFEKYIDSFSNNGNSTENSMAWFFNGAYNSEEYMQDFMAVPKAGTGKFFKDYAYDKITKDYDFFKGTDTMKQFTRDIRNGKGIVLGIDYLFDNGELGSGHAVSCWGYVTDNDYSEDEAEHYDMLIITDSDSDFTGINDRRTAPNRLCAYEIEPYLIKDDIFESSEAEQTWLFSGYGSYILSDYSSVTPYSADLEKETLIKATRNKNTTVDFSALDIFTGENETPDGHYPVTDDVDAYIAVNYKNASFKETPDTVNINLTVTDKNGNTVYNRTKSFSGFEFSYGDFSITSVFNAGKLSAGEYTASATINPDKKLREAFFYNNTVSSVFTVEKSYFDRSNVRLKLSSPNPGYNAVSYDFAVEGLSGEQLEMIESAELYGIEYFDYDTNERYEYEIECEYDNFDDIFPTVCWFENQTDVSLKLKLNLKNHPPVYIYSDTVSIDYPQIDIEGDDRFNVSKFYKVKDNATGFENGQKLEFKISNESGENYQNKTVSGSYHLEATGSDGNVVVLTDPVDFSLEYSKTKKVTITNFDYPLPKGYYELNIVLDGGFVWNKNYIYMSLFIASGADETEDYNFGDVNLDGEVDISDATLLQKYLAKITDLSDIQLELAEVYKDGTVNIADVTAIQKMISE